MSERANPLTQEPGPSVSMTTRHKQMEGNTVPVEATPNSAKSRTGKIYVYFNNQIHMNIVLYI